MSRITSQITSSPAVRGIAAAALLAGTLVAGLPGSAQAGWGSHGQYGIPAGAGMGGGWGGYGGHPGGQAWTPGGQAGHQSWSSGTVPSWVQPHIHYPPAYPTQVVGPVYPRPPITIWHPPVVTPGPIYWHPPVYWYPPVYRPPVVVVQRPVYRPPVVVVQRPVYTPPPVVYAPPVTYAPPVVAPVVTPAVTPVPGACSCLTKHYTPDGQVVFADLCTKETAAAVVPASQPAPVAYQDQGVQDQGAQAQSVQAQPYAAAPPAAQ